jgi:hypothetical protein
VSTPHANEVAERVFSALQRFVSTKADGRPTIIGECAAWWFEGKHEAGYAVCVDCCVWDAEFNDSSAIAKVVHEAGGVDVLITHTLYSDGNGDRGGLTFDHTREWYVKFTVKP